MTLYTTEQALTAMAEVVAEHGEDYVYSDEYKNKDGDCVYAVHGKPSCLIGHVIYKLDPDAFDDLAAHEAGWGSASAGDLIADQYLLPGFWDNRTAMVMQEAQALQDREGTWGAAYEVALNANRNLSHD